MQASQGKSRNLLSVQAAIRWRSVSNPNIRKDSSWLTNWLFFPSDSTSVVRVVPIGSMVVVLESCNQRRRRLTNTSVPGAVQIRSWICQTPKHLPRRTLTFSRNWPDNSWWVSFFAEFLMNPIFYGGFSFLTDQPEQLALQTSSGSKWRSALLWSYQRAHGWVVIITRIQRKIYNF